jgi:hypothetical protein
LPPFNTVSVRIPTPVAVKVHGSLAHAASPLLAQTSQSISPEATPVQAVPVVPKPLEGQHAVLLAPGDAGDPGDAAGEAGASFFFIWSTKMSNEASLFTRETPQPPLFFQCMPKVEHLVSPARGSKIFLSSALMASVLVLSNVFFDEGAGLNDAAPAGEAFRALERHEPERGGLGAVIVVGLDAVGGRC